MILSTVGYEEQPLAGVIGKLAAARVEIVIDVRAIAASRRPGFSKRALAASLGEAGIDYVHLRALGTPKEGRLAARAGHTAEMRRIFAAHLEEPQAQLAIAEAAEIASKRRACLLCYERDARACHRALVGERLCASHGFEIVDL